MKFFLSVLMSCAPVFAQEPGGLRWPVGSGTKPYPLRATYAQFEGCYDDSGNSGSLHLGLDILYRTPETEYEIVHAIEAGTVKRVRRKSIDYSAVVIESSSVSDRAFLYLHLDRNSILVNVGDVVSVGQPIGRIAYGNLATGEAHLHLSRLGEGFKSHTWSDLDELSTANPLKLLKPEYLGDSDKPLVTAGVNAASLFMRPNETGAIPASASGHVWMDVIVQASDRAPLSTHLLAPYEIELTVTTQGTTKPVSKLTLDGKLGTEDSILYNIDGAFLSCGETQVSNYTYFFVITNGGSPPSKANAWDASPGDHVLHAKIFDAQGNSTTVSQSVHIP